jgi:hypothetical protein
MSTRGYYPGFDALISLDLSSFTELFTELLGLPIQIIDKASLGYMFSQISEKAPLKLRHYPHPHVDMFGRKNPHKFAAVIYLNLPDSCRGGTGFYQHKASGIIKFPSSITPEVARYMEQHGLDTPKRLLRHLLVLHPYHEENIKSAGHKWNLISNSNDFWEQIHRVDMQFNRLVVYDAMCFHCPVFDPEHFSEKHHARRLTQNFFMERVSVDFESKEDRLTEDDCA